MKRRLYKLSLFLFAALLLLPLAACRSDGQKAALDSTGDSEPATALINESNGYIHVTVDNTVQNVINHPAFEGFGGYILTSGEESSYYADQTLDKIGSLLPYHRHIDTDTTIKSINYLIDEVNSGKLVFYDYYSDEEKQAGRQ